MSEAKILIVDDDPDIVEFIQYNLTKHDYNIATATNGLDAIEIAKKTKPDLIILDVMMPGLDGVETCHRMRSIESLQQCIVVFLTARSEEYSEIAGLEAGGDDYIHKPISPRLLLARIKSLLRRQSENSFSSKVDVLEVGGIKINKNTFTVEYKETDLDLPKKEFDILWLLASKPGKVFTRKEIYRKIWGDDVIVGNRTIDVHVSKLREKILDNRIRTIKGIGYKLEI